MTCLTLVLASLVPDDLPNYKEGELALRHCVFMQGYFDWRPYYSMGS